MADVYTGSMGLGGILLIGLVLLVLVAGMYTMITNPRDIDQEEEESVEKERTSQDKRRRWWHRR